MPSHHNSWCEASRTCRPPALSTFAGTTSRWGQRVVNSVAAQKGWELFTADVSLAFLRGMTFEEAAKLKDEVKRSIQFTIPLGGDSILQMLPEYKDFDFRSEVLEMGAATDPFDLSSLFAANGWLDVSRSMKNVRRTRSSSQHGRRG